MQSFVRICVAIWVLAGLTLVPAPAVAAPARVPGITISPPVGTLTTTFVFTGTGFPAGMILTAAFLDPTGVPYDSYTSGQPLTVTVDGRGRFELSIVPSRDLPGAVAGRWQFEFCVATGGSQCWGETFDITAPGRPAAAPPAAVSRTAGITVSPPTGNATTTFVFTGAGFPAGMILTAAFLDPTGIQYDSYTSGQPITVTVDGRGGFEVGVVPLRDFPGSSAGRWRFEFCVATGGSDCWGETFDVTAAGRPAAAPPAAVGRTAGITVSPPVGLPNTTFVFTGAGFPAGMILTAAFLDPTGIQYDSYTSGQPITVTVDGRGGFEVGVVPLRDFPGSSPGRWRFEFCVATGGSDCWGETFDITR